MPAVHTPVVDTLTGQSMPPGAATVRTPALRHWRVQRMLLQEELAKKAKVAVVSIRRGEAGQPLRLTTVRALARALNVSAAQLQAPAPEDKN